MWVVDSLWHLTLVTNLVKYNTLGAEKACDGGVCAADWSHSRSFLPDLLFNEILHKFGEC